MDINKFKTECSEKFGDRFIYPEDENAYGRYKEDTILIYDTVKEEYFTSTPANHKKSYTGRSLGTSSLEDSVANLLKKNNIPFTSQFVMDDWKRAKVDFVVGSVAIECQGDHHYMINNKFGSGKTETQILNDRKKACLMANLGYTVVYISKYAYPQTLRADFINYFTFEELDSVFEFIKANYKNPIAKSEKEFIVENEFATFEGFGSYSDETIEKVLYMFNNRRLFAAEIAKELGLTARDVSAILTLNGITSEDIIEKQNVLKGCPIYGISKKTGEIEFAFAHAYDAADYMFKTGRSRSNHRSNSSLSRRLREKNLTLYGCYWRRFSEASKEEMVAIKAFMQSYYPEKILGYLEIA